MSAPTIARTLPTLDEVRERRNVPAACRLPIPVACVCGGLGTCTRCVLDDERIWKRREDV